MGDVSTHPSPDDSTSVWMNQQDTIAYSNSLGPNGARLTSRQQVANGGERHTPISFGHHNGGGGLTGVEFMPHSGSAPSQFIATSSSASPTTFRHHHSTVVNGGASSLTTAASAAGCNTTTVYVTNTDNENPSVPAHLHNSQQAQSQRIAIQFPANSPMAVGGQQPQHIIIAAPPSTLNDHSPVDEKQDHGGGGHGGPTTFVEYYIEQQPGCSTSGGGDGASPTATPTMRYGAGRGGRSANAIVKVEREMMKKARQAEAARQRYHRLSPDEKKALNVRRTVAQKRKRQREKELAELEQILRQSNDIFDDPEVIEQLREKRMRAKWAEAARNRYQKMSEADRRVHNSKRKTRQTGPKQSEKDDDVEGTGTPNDSNRELRLNEQNKRKAEAARQRYHRMSTEEKKLYNARRTDAFRRRRMEEEALLAMPIGRINGEALERAQQIVVRNAKRAEAARLRYQRMSADQRKVYNQKRYTPKRRMIPLVGQEGSGGEIDVVSNNSAGTRLDVSKMEFDALTSLERDVVKRTHQAQQALVKQRQTATAAIPTLIPIGLSGQPGQQMHLSHASQQAQTIQIIHPSSGAQHMIAGSMAAATNQQPQQLLTTRHLNQPHSIQVQYIRTAGAGGNTPGTIVSTAPLTTPQHLITYRGGGDRPAH